MSANSAPARPGPISRFLAIGQRPEDDSDLRVRKRTAVGTIVLLVLAGLAYTTVGLVADRPGLTVFSLVQALGQAAGLAYLWRTGRLGPVVVNMMALGLLVMVSGAVVLGGLRQGNANMVWGLLVPIGGVLFFGRRAALPGFVAYAMVVVGMAVLDPLLVANAGAPLSDAVSLALYVLNVLGATAVGLGMVVFIDGERMRAKGQAESLLLNVLPRAIVARLHAGERTIADHCPDVTVLFSDVVDFTPFAELEPPERVVAVLNELFSDFDRLAEQRGLEKIKTIGDAYMVVAGVPDERPDHAPVMLDMALAMHAVVDRRPPVGDRRLRLRTGIATGPVVAGVIGRQKFSYDLWGDTVNTASRMESSGVPGCIQVTHETWDRCRADYPWQVREGVEVKGKGPMRTYLLDPAAIPVA
ncbi:MAG TPA: adenylate/guanylate cyclase domain-containing protein [Candidatus Limnocylindria bacterium]